MFLFNYACFVVSLVYDGLAFKIYDGQNLIEDSPVVTMGNAEVAEVIDIDPDGEYTTMGFKFEHDQTLGMHYDSPYERCQNDHIRCLTSVVSSSRLVCGINRDLNIKTEFGSLCNIYLENCKKGEAYWTVIDYGNCTRAEEIATFKFPTEKQEITEPTTTEHYIWAMIKKVIPDHIISSITNIVG